MSAGYVYAAVMEAISLFGAVYRFVTCPSWEAAQQVLNEMQDIVHHQHLADVCTAGKSSFYC